MERLTKRTPDGVAYMAIADTLPKKDQEIEGSKPILEGLYAMFQKLANYEDKEEKDIEIKQWLNDMQNPLEPIKVESALQSEIMKLNYRQEHDKSKISILDYTIIAVLAKELGLN